MLRRIEHASRNTAGASLCVDLLGCVLKAVCTKGEDVYSSRNFQKDGVTKSRGFVKHGPVPLSSNRIFQQDGVTKSRGFVKLGQVPLSSRRRSVRVGLQSGVPKSRGFVNMCTSILFILIIISLLFLDAFLVTPW